jgi:hypothetical protein
MKTEELSQMVAEVEAGGDRPAPNEVHGNTAGSEAVIAVVVERDDRTCSLFCRGSGGSWHSIEEAKDAVGRISSEVTWRETTPGVWIARTGTNKPPVSDRGSGVSRRQAAGPKKTSSRGDTYMAARVLRGIGRSSRSSVTSRYARQDAPS